MVTNHLSWIIIKKKKVNGFPISECFPNEQLLMVIFEPWYIDIVSYLVTGEVALVKLSAI